MNITIVGLGLIGGSMAMSLKADPAGAYTVTGMDNDPAVIRYGLAQGIIDQGSDNLMQSVADADVIFLCTPVLQIVPMVQNMLPFLKLGTIITDVGSTKRFIQDRLRDILPPMVYYVGGHPMTGREKSGITAAHKDLFKDKWYILIPDTTASPQAIDIVYKLVQQTGAKLTAMDTALHDRCAAVISHVPHITAAALVNLLDMQSDPELSLKLAAGGFRDTTRIASSNSDMWADICITNAEIIIHDLRNMQELMEQIISAMEQGDRNAIHGFFARAKARRDSLIENTEPEND